MKEEKDIFDQFREKDHTSEVRPSAQSWEKLTQKIDKFQEKETPVIPFYKRLKVWSIAAGVAIILGLASIIIPMAGDTNAKTAMNAPMVIEDLDYAKPTGFYALAIKTNKYYNRSPKLIAEEDGSKRLQITAGKTRLATTPSFSTKKDMAPIAMKESNAIEVTTIVLSDSNVVSASTELGNNVLAENEMANAVEAESARLANAIEVESDDDTVREWGPDNPAPSYSKAATTAPAKRKLENSEDKIVPTSIATSAAEGEMDAAINAISYDADMDNSPDIEYFKWLIGEWKTKERNGQQNAQNWMQKDEFTLEGTAVLTINNESINIENLVIKKIGDQLYFLRVNDTNGNTLTYELKGMENNTVIFRNASLGDEIRLEQQSANKFKNGFNSNGSLQLNQYPGFNKEAIEYKRVKQ